MRFEVFLSFSAPVVALMMAVFYHKKIYRYLLVYMRVANIFYLHLDLVPKRLLTTVVGFETDAEKPEGRGSVRRTTISGG